MSKRSRGGGALNAQCEHSLSVSAWLYNPVSMVVKSCEHGLSAACMVVKSCEHAISVHAHFHIP